MPRFAIHKEQMLPEEEEQQNTNYYLRLEIEEASILKSWKILQSMPSEPGNQSRAIMYQQDLPLIYLYVENTPEEADSDTHGYEADTIISLWDTGTYKTLNIISSSSITEQIRSGKVELFFAGAKLYGRFSLLRESLRTHAGKSSQRKDGNDIWYFVKEQDNDRKRVGLTVTQQLPSQRQKAVSKRQPNAAITPPPKQKKVTTPTIATGFPRTIKPMLATPVDEPFDDDQWVFEFKWDGVRSILFLNKASGILEIQSRNGKSITHRYPDIVDVIKKSLIGGNNSSIKCKESVILDGEIVVLNERGVPDFQKHQRRMNIESASEIITLSGKMPATYYVFDILYLDGRNLQGLPFIDRRKILSDVIIILGGNSAADSRIRISEYVEGQGRQMFEQAKSMDLEGVVAKWKLGRYLQGSRSGSWLKVKRIKTQDCVVIGYTPGEGRREGYFGSLLLAVNDQGNLRFAGHTGSGFDTVTIMELYDRLQKLRILTPSQDILDTVQFINREPIWVKPDLVAEVKFSEWTKDGIMRVPIFVRLREDKLPHDCTVEKEKGLEEISSLASSSSSSSVMPASATAAKVEFANLDKIFWPQIKENPSLTKKDLIDYYDSISPYILPYLKDRPLSLLRFPDGIRGESFFHRNWEGQSRPKYVVSVMVYAETRRKKTNQLVCNNKETLLWLANLGCIEMHPMHSSVIDYKICQESQDPNDVGCGLNMPDFVVIDLDPYIYASTQKQEKGEEPQYNIQAFKATVEVALELKALMDELHLRSYVKTSGKTGLHIFIPISKLRNTEAITYEKTREFAKKIGSLLVTRIPQKVTMEWNVKERAGKVFFDHNQNSRAKTLASVFSVRPTSLATVSMPVRWDKLTDILPTDFTLLNVSEIIKKSGNTWKQMLEDRQDILSHGIG